MDLVLSSVRCGWGRISANRQCICVSLVRRGYSVLGCIVFYSMFCQRWDNYTFCQQCMNYIFWIQCTPNPVTVILECCDMKNWCISFTIFWRFQLRGLNCCYCVYDSWVQESQQFLLVQLGKVRFVMRSSVLAVRYQSQLTWLLWHVVSVSYTHLTLPTILRV